LIAAAPRTTSAIKRAANRIAANSLMKERTGVAYSPRGSALELMACTESEVLLSGPAGTGKSRACLQKIHYAMEQYPGARALIVRKTRASLSETGLQTFEDHVLGPDHPLRNGPQRIYRQHYPYRNGSEVIVGGMDNQVRIMSSEYDIIYVQEAIELDEDDWEPLTTRKRNFKMPFQQIIADTNPSFPRHWLKQRCDRGSTRLIPCKHEDNPVLWDLDKGDWTERGRKYIEDLDKLTGATKDRLRYGLWVQATGVIFDMFNEEIHVNNQFDYNPDLGSVYWACDDGYVEGRGIGTESYHPRVILLCQINQLGGINVFKEYHRTGVAKYTETIEEVRGYGYPDPEVAYVDAAAAQFRGELTLCDISTCTARHRVEEGIREPPEDVQG
jgi:hypothetical protein